jgi:hypothetical protein
VVSENPVASYLKEKTSASFVQGVRAGSGFGNPGRMGAAVGRGAAGAAGALAVAGGAAIASKLYDVATKAHDFRTMLEENPDVAAEHQENPRRVNQFFTTLRTFNPQFSRDPVVAGTYMRKMLLEPQTAGGYVENALNFRDKMGPSVGDQVTRAALGGKKK